jgi:hypothetical protein
MAGEKAIKAFLNHRDKVEKNTVSNGLGLYLFGNKIAEWRETGLWITNAGWQTITTKDRLCKLGATVRQVKGKWYLFGKEWDGDWINITEYLNL